MAISEWEVQRVKTMGDKELENLLNEKGINAVDGIFVGGMERHEMEHAWLLNEHLLKKEAKKTAKTRIIRFYNAVTKWEDWLW